MEELIKVYVEEVDFEGGIMWQVHKLSDNSLHWQAFYGSKASAEGVCNETNGVELVAHP